MAIPDSAALYIENAGAINNAVDMRRLTGALVGYSNGIASPTDLQVTEKSGTPNMSVDVSLGGAFVLGTESATAGSYFVFNDATANVVVGTADATNPRDDLICLQIRDAVYSGSDNDARIVCVAGTPAASPAEPTVPDNSYVLAKVRVDALASSILNAKITDRRSLAAPAQAAGTISMFAAATPPAGWLICDGTAISRTTYAGLFAVIGTTWGAGDGSTTFNVPDLRGRSPIGAGTGSGLTARTLGTSYGAETVALSTAEMPTHSHAAATGSGGPTTHAHNTDTGNRFVVTEATSIHYTTLTAGGQAVSFSDVDPHAAHTHSVSAEGSGTAHANLHPVKAVHYIVKT